MPVRKRGRKTCSPWKRLAEPHYLPRNFVSTIPCPSPTPIPTPCHPVANGSRAIQSTHTHTSCQARQWCLNARFVAGGSPPHFLHNPSLLLTPHPKCGTEALWCANWADIPIIHHPRTRMSTVILWTSASVCEPASGCGFCLCICPATCMETVLVLYEWNHNRVC